MKVSFYQAECGNAAKMEFRGTDGLIHNVFVDSGFERTFRHILASEIREIESKNQVIDAWIISHIHDDHIGGVLAYIAAIESGEFPDIVQQWCYNSPRGTCSKKTVSIEHKISEAKSIAQGDKLISYLTSINKLPDKDVCTNLETIDLFGLRLTIISPDVSTLGVLRKKYPTAKNNPLERNEDSGISLAKAATTTDYNVPLHSFSSLSRKEDTSIENGSSISFIAELNGKRILWLADAFSGTIINALEQIGHTPENPLVCDWVTVAHHGSSGNNIDELYARIRCSNYLISADGNNNAKLPTKACLASILSSPRRNTAKCNLHFTYNNNTLRGIFKVDGPGVYDTYNFQAYYSNQPVMIFSL